MCMVINRVWAVGSSLICSQYQGCGSGSWQRKRSFFCGNGSGSAKILPLALRHTLFNLEHRRTRREGRGGRPPPPGLKNFRANFVFRATASSSKILNNKIYFSTAKNSRATLFFRASGSCSKMLNNKKSTSDTVNSRHPLFFRASASYSKILNVKSIFNTVRNSRATLFSGQAQVTQNSRIIKNISNTAKYFRASASCSKILNNKKTHSI